MRQFKRASESMPLLEIDRGPGTAPYPQGIFSTLQGTNELGLYRMGKDALFKTPVEQGLHRFAAALAVVKCPIIDVHGDKSVRRLSVKSPGKLQRIGQRFFTVIHAVLDARFEQF